MHTVLEAFLIRNIVLSYLSLINENTMKNKYNANCWVPTISINAYGKARWLRGCFSPFTGTGRYVCMLCMNQCKFNLSKVELRLLCLRILYMLQ